VTDAAIEAFARAYAYSPVLAQIQTKVRDTMKDAGDKLVAQLSARRDATLDEFIAADYGLQRYATLCAISTIESLAAAALTNALVTPTNPPKGAPPPRARLADGTPRRLLPDMPNYTIAPQR
jgi:hypothetical protein